MSWVRVDDPTSDLIPELTLVYLDGKLLDNAIEADDVEGYVIVYKKWPPDTEEEDEFIRLEGKVELKKGRLADELPI